MSKKNSKSRSQSVLLRNIMLMVKKSHKFLPLLYVHSFLFKNMYVCIYVCMYFLFHLIFNIIFQLTFNIIYYSLYYILYIIVLGVSIVVIYLHNFQSDHPNMTAAPIKGRNFPHTLNLGWPTDLLWPKKVTELPPCGFWACIFCPHFLASLRWPRKEVWVGSLEDEREAELTVSNKLPDTWVRTFGTA